MLYKAYVHLSKLAKVLPAVLGSHPSLKIQVVHYSSPTLFFVVVIIFHHSAYQLFQKG